MTALPLLECPRGDRAWSCAKLVENLEGGDPAQGTILRTCWSSSAWHLHFECVDANPWATLTQPDAKLWEEEVVEIFVDPVGDGLAYFEIEVNPLGTICDLVLRRVASGWRRELAWNCDGLQARVTRITNGWTAEIELPFRALVDSAPEPGTEWRANFLRIDRPLGRDGPRELTAWSPTYLPTFHAAERFGIVRFV